MSRPFEETWSQSIGAFVTGAVVIGILLISLAVHSTCEYATRNDFSSSR